MKITMVKKVMLDGSPCKKCAEVELKMRSTGHLDHIDQVLIADENDPSSPGMLLASEFNVARAPFFVVEKPGQPPLVYTVYLKFVKEILKEHTAEKDEIQEIMENNPDLDFL